MPTAACSEGETLMRRKAGAIAVLAAMLAACGASSVPSDQEARAFLSEVVAAVGAGDIGRLCELSNCMPDDRRPFQAPGVLPTVIGTRIIQPTADSLGGKVLVLCGLAPDSTTYRFEMLIFRANGALHTPTYRYWRNMTVSGGSSATTPPGPQAPGICPTT